MQWSSNVLTELTWIKCLCNCKWIVWEEESFTVTISLLRFIMWTHCNMTVLLGWLYIDISVHGTECDFHLCKHSWQNSGCWEFAGCMYADCMVFPSLPAPPTILFLPTKILADFLIHLTFHIIPVLFCEWKIFLVTSPHLIKSFSAIVTSSMLLGGRIVFHVHSFLVVHIFIPLFSSKRPPNFPSEIGC